VAQTDMAGEINTDTAGKISVVISTLNRPHLLARCLDGLIAGTRLPAEIVVVDQGRPRDVEAVLEALPSHGVRLVHVVHPGRGLAVSQNAGFAAAQNPIVCVVDDDCVPDAHWVEVAAKVHQEYQRPLLVGGRVLPLPPEGDKRIPMSTRTSTVRRVLSPSALPWEAGTGGNFSVTRETYLRIGGNDERLGTGSPGHAGNDLDLFHRVRRAGAQALFEPDLLVFHQRGTLEEHRSRLWTYGYGVGACVGIWLWLRDADAARVLVGWLRMRVGILRQSRQLGVLHDEARVVLGTVHGLAYGVVAGSSSLRGRDGLGWRALRVVRHPRASLQRLGQRRWSPFGSHARDRRLLRAMTPNLTGDVLVIGGGQTVEGVLHSRGIQAVDLVGTDPRMAATTVVSEARGAGSLPEERWDAVLITATEPELSERLQAATTACRRGGVILVCASPHLPEVERWLRTGVVRLLDARPAARPCWLLARKMR
jgi:GT2 family glycosyltransferase